MKEVKLVSNQIWTSVALVLSSLIIASASIFIALEYNKTQRDVASMQKEAQIKASQNIKTGMEDIGHGICTTSTKQFMICS